MWYASILAGWLLLALGLALWLGHQLRKSRTGNYRVSDAEEAEQWLDLWDQRVRHLPEAERIKIRNMVNVAVYNYRQWPPPASATGAIGRRHAKNEWVKA